MAISIKIGQDPIHAKWHWLKMLPATARFVITPIQRKFQYSTSLSSSSFSRKPHALFSGQYLALSVQTGYCYCCRLAELMDVDRSVVFRLFMLIIATVAVF